MSRRLALLSALGAARVVFACESPSPHPGPAIPFQKLTLDDAYRAEGVAVFDVNRDGFADIVTDQFWYEGPTFASHEIRTPQVYDDATQYSDGMGIYPLDVDSDGWVDIVVAPHVPNTMYWYANPAGADVHWTPHVLAAQGVDGLETPILSDLFGDGHPVIVMTSTALGELGWFAPGADPTLPWSMKTIVGAGYPGSGVYTHGVGIGDVNGDGKADVLTGYGWYEQTADRATWIAHPFAFGPNPQACSRMFAYDLDGDGLSDVLCSRPHDYSIHWWQQQAVAGADPVFVDHVIDSTISQMHALRLDDLDGDGIPEIISGKRFWAHVTGDPGANDPAILTYYRILGGAGAPPTFERHDIDDDSGVGDQFSVADVNGDGKADVVVSNKKGLHVFTQQ